MKRAQSGYRVKVIIFKSIHRTRVDASFLENRENSCIFKGIRIRVHGALGKSKSGASNYNNMLKILSLYVHLM